MMNGVDTSLNKPHAKSSMNQTSPLKVGLAAFIVSYARIESSLGVNAFGPGGILGTSASTKNKVNIWSGIVGVGGALRLGDDGKWYVPYEFDGGAASSNHSSVTSFNGILRLGYRFGWAMSWWRGVTSTTRWAPTTPSRK
jgi:hypothetical protein